MAVGGCCSNNASCGWQYKWTMGSIMIRVGTILSFRWGDKEKRVKEKNRLVKKLREREGARRDYFVSYRLSEGEEVWKRREKSVKRRKRANASKSCNGWEDENKRQRQRGKEREWVCVRVNLSDLISISSKARNCWHVILVVPETRNFSRLKNIARKRKEKIMKLLSDFLESNFVADKKFSFYFIHLVSKCRLIYAGDKIWIGRL